MGTSLLSNNDKYMQSQSCFDRLVRKSIDVTWRPFDQSRCDFCDKVIFEKKYYYIVIVRGEIIYYYLLLFNII